MRRNLSAYDLHVAMIYMKPPVWGHRLFSESTYSFFQHIHGNPNKVSSLDRFPHPSVQCSFLFYSAIAANLPHIFQSSWIQASFFALISLLVLLIQDTGVWCGNISRCELIRSWRNHKTFSAYTICFACFYQGIIVHSIWCFANYTIQKGRMERHLSAHIETISIN